MEVGKGELMSCTVCDPAECSGNTDKQGDKVTSSLPPAYYFTNTIRLLTPSTTGRYTDLGVE